MAQLIVTYDPRGVDLFKKASAALSSPDKIDRAIHEGIRQAGDKMRTVVRHTLKVQMGIKAYGSVVKGTRSYIPGRFSYAIEGTSKGEYIAKYNSVKASVKIPSVRFSRRQHWKMQPRVAGGRFGAIPDSMNPKTGGVTASPWNVAHQFKRSFQDDAGVFRAIIKSGKSPVSGRRRKLFGPGTWKEIVQGATLAVFHAQAPALMEQYVGNRLAKLLP